MVDPVDQKFCASTSGRSGDQVASQIKETDSDWAAPMYLPVRYRHPGCLCPDGALRAGDFLIPPFFFCFLG